MLAKAAPATPPANLAASLFEALVEAAEIVRRGSNAHVTRDEDGEYFATQFVPVRGQRREWLRVRMDGVVEEGNTLRVLGSLAELGIAGPVGGIDCRTPRRSSLVELATVPDPNVERLGAALDELDPKPARPRRIRKAGPR